MLFQGGSGKVQDCGPDGGSQSVPVPDKLSYGQIRPTHFRPGTRVDSASGLAAMTCEI